MAEGLKERQGLKICNKNYESQGETVKHVKDCDICINGLFPLNYIFIISYSLL